mmetsp:Transcript_91910/g.297278  ORF Transcript_91910/g.297278 Transcript_91910/m.297278 type:complete len:442 (-) Transcript_91910:56-1381(-)
MLGAAFDCTLFLFNVHCVFFLLVRWHVLRAFLRLLLHVLRALCRTPAKKAGADAEFASPLLQDVQWAVAQGLQLRVRLAVTAFLFLAAGLAMRCSRWLAPLTVFAAVLKDALQVLTSGMPPADGLAWCRDRYGMEVGVQPSPCQTHIVITGGVSLAAYTTGVLHAMFQRYGAEAFAGCDFAGASSGSWTAACAVFAANGCRDMEQLCELIFITACQLTELYPLGLLFVGCEAVDEVCSWAMRLAEAKFPGAHDAISRDGKLAIWLFGFNLWRSRPFSKTSSAYGGCYRLLVRSGPDFRCDRVGQLVSATSVFPYFTPPALCSRLSCLSAALDGYFPGKGSSLLPVPDMAAPGTGTTLLFDMSGGLKEVYRDDRDVWVVSIREWRNFEFKDWAASSAEAFRRLFDAGVSDASERWPELDRMMLAVLGARPCVDPLGEARAAR